MKIDINEVRKQLETAQSHIKDFASYGYHGMTVKENEISARELDKACKALDEAMRLLEPVSQPNLTPEEYSKLVTWMNDPKRPLINSTFTGGAVRDAALAFEDYLRMQGKAEHGL